MPSENDVTQADTANSARLDSVIYRNIQDILAERRKVERRQSFSERIAGAIARAAGNMWFAYLHVAWFGGWILLNSLNDGFDPFPFFLLTTVVSLEAIFLTLMVLVSQNREARLEEQRANLDLQIDLLAEHEVTHLIAIVRAIAHKVGIPESQFAADLDREVRPRDLIHALEKADPEATDEK